MRYCTVVGGGGRKNAYVQGWKNIENHQTDGRNKLMSGGASERG